MLYEKVKKYLEQNNISDVESLFGWEKTVNAIVLENHSDGNGDFIQHWDSEKVGVTKPTQEELDAI